MLSLLNKITDLAIKLKIYVIYNLFHDMFDA